MPRFDRVGRELFLYGCGTILVFGVWHLHSRPADLQSSIQREQNPLVHENTADSGPDDSRHGAKEGRQLLFVNGTSVRQSEKLLNVHQGRPTFEHASGNVRMSKLSENSKGTSTREEVAKNRLKSISVGFSLGDNVSSEGSSVAKLSSLKLNGTGNVTVENSSLILKTREISKPRSQKVTKVSEQTLESEKNSSSNRNVVSSTSSTPSSNTTDTSKKLLCVRFTGRLGNELFQYASTLGLALTLHRTPVFIGSVHLPSVLKHFGDPSVNYTQLHARCDKAASVGEKTCCKWEESLTKLDPSKDFKVGLYLQSYRYFDDHQAEIRQALTFSDAIRNESSRIVNDLRRKYNSSTLVAMHLRRGDLTAERNKKLGYPLVSQAFVNRSMAFFKALYPDAVFVVGSDSPEWCQQKLSSVSQVHCLAPRSAAVDMLTLSSMAHRVVSFGTYSWWVGYLTRARTVVYMKNFLVNGTHIAKGFHPDGRDYFYPGWIPL
ncbi:galactoside alpha-(1,2)-fucosyltransferase 2-like isoform X2 [Littorina saxatilis]|uniref:galactoside alpha-(1,2)-fucosyltransferase 2-like isoform X2 n=1 Tax=Littorina saxatilis TaxID=31220 RepID=UPI0038B464F0